MGDFGGGRLKKRKKKKKKIVSFKISGFFPEVVFVQTLKSKQAAAQGGGLNSFPVKVVFQTWRHLGLLGKLSNTWACLPPTPIYLIRPEWWVVWSVFLHSFKCSSGHCNMLRGGSSTAVECGLPAPEARTYVCVYVC